MFLQHLMCLMLQMLAMKVKGKDESIEQFATSLTILDQTVLLTKVTFPPLPKPIKAGTQFNDPGGMQG